MKKLLIALLVVTVLIGAIVLSTSAEAETRTADCPYCGKSVEWTPITQSNKTIGDGHYYLYEDITGFGQKTITGTTCLDLNGKTATTTGRSLLVNTENSILNIIDSQSNGAIVSQNGSNNVAGGTVRVSGNGTLNLYSGTLRYISSEGSVTARGGVVDINGGAVNVYGGKIDASQCTLAGSNNGAAVYIATNSTLNISGGELIQGKKSDNTDNCVYVSDTTAVVTLSGDAAVDRVLFAKASASSLVIDGAYTGTVKLTYASNLTIKENDKIGMLINNGSVDNADISFENERYTAATSGTDLVLAIKPAPTKTGWCEYCKEDVTWEPWTNDFAKTVMDIPTGHYYLFEDLPNNAVKGAKGVVCLDLNGHTMKTKGRSFIVSSMSYTEGTPILNVMDSKGGGCVVSTDGSNNPNGGTAYVVNDGILNLYGGTLKHVTDGTKSVVKLGGVVCLYSSSSSPSGGTMNIYGGCIDASECNMKELGMGSAIYISLRSTLNAYSGTVIGGTISGNIKDGECVYLDDLTASVMLTGDAKIDEIRFKNDPQNCLTVNGNYTGKVTLAYAEGTAEYEGFVTGKAENKADVSGADMRSLADSYFVNVLDGNLVLTRLDPSCEAAVVDGNKVTNCDSLADALAIANGKRIQLNKNITTAVSIDQDTYLDLNGCSITGKVKVAEGKTLYCMDSKTDDYTVADGRYGKLTDVEGAVQGIPLESDITVDAYMMITENGEMSFHRIGLQMVAMTLRSNVAGVYYKSDFGIDEMIADRIKGYGVALSVYAEPTAENLEDSCGYTYFTNFTAGGLDTDATSTLLTGVMKEKNSESRNEINANTPIYGRAYFLMDDGTYLFGATANRSFKEQVEATSDIWYSLNKTQKDSVDAMYNLYRNIIDKWDAMNIHAYKDPSRDDVIRILNISNSHGQDSVWLLPKVLKAERPDLKFVVAECYAAFGLPEHINAAKENTADYKYWTNSGDGWSGAIFSSSLEALQAQSWDIVMFNESSRYLGVERMMSQGLIDWYRNYILENLDYEPTLLYNMTWASPTDERFYTDETRQKAPDYFKNTYTNDYGFDHVNHYNCLVALTKKYLVNHEGFDKIIYNATPIQYASEICGVPQYDEKQVYDLYRDYTHISDFGRLIVAYNWFCQMFDVDELSEVKVDIVESENRAEYGNRQRVYGDLELTEDHKNVLIESINHSLKNPLAIPEKAE